MDTPFTIGDTYYLPHHDARQVQVTCPVCEGKKVVTLLLGNGERVDVSCEGCGLGYEEPRGYTMEYSYTPFVSVFVVASVESMYSGKWTLKSTGGETAEFMDLLQSEAEARAVATRNTEERQNHNMRNSEARTKAQRGILPWTVRYHEQCIKDLEQKIAWHRTKVSERKKVS